MRKPSAVARHRDLVEHRLGLLPPPAERACEVGRRQLGRGREDEPGQLAPRLGLGRERPQLEAAGRGGRRATAAQPRSCSTTTGVRQHQPVRCSRSDGAVDVLLGGAERPRGARGRQRAEVEHRLAEAELEPVDLAAKVLGRPRDL